MKKNVDDDDDDDVANRKNVRGLRLLNIRWSEYEKTYAFAMGSPLWSKRCQDFKIYYFFAFACYLRMCLSESHQIGFMLSVHEENVYTYTVYTWNAGSLFCLHIQTMAHRQFKNETIAQKKPMQNGEGERKKNEIHLSRHVEEMSLIRLYILL